MINLKKEKEFLNSWRCCLYVVILFLLILHIGIGRMTSQFFTDLELIIDKEINQQANVLMRDAILKEIQNKTF